MSKKIQYPCVIVRNEILPSGFIRVALCWKKTHSIQLNLSHNITEAIEEAKQIATGLDVPIYQRQTVIKEIVRAI